MTGTIPRQGTGIKPSTHCFLRSRLQRILITQQAVALGEADHELKVANESGNTVSVIASASSTVVAVG
jgi:hypothetical protein